MAQAQAQALDDAGIMALVRSRSEFHDEAMRQVLDAVERVVRGGVPGDLVEIGVYRGAMVMAMAAKLRQLGVTDRRVHLYDTFAGMTPPTERDGRNGAAPDMASPAVLSRSPLEEVKANMALTGYPEAMLTYHVGDVCATADEDVPPVIAFLRLDTDWYESTRFELERFAPRVSRGGVVTQDDYGFWDGATAAVDEHLASRPDVRPRRMVPHGVWWVVVATAAAAAAA